MRRRRRERRGLRRRRGGRRLSWITLPLFQKGRGRRGGRKNFLVAALDVDNGSVLFLVRSSSTLVEACAGLVFLPRAVFPLVADRPICSHHGRYDQEGWFLSTAPRIWQSLVRCSLWFDSGYMVRQSTAAFVGGAFRIQRNSWFDSGFAR